ncbi:hypothetical protein [Lysinibacillus xylanilyticus]|uniref:hypothetical protein n=1 Tax=Lysinibacillus xylanilyticus TaxID=582475 RepID=UPI0038211340
MSMKKFFIKCLCLGLAIVMSSTFVTTADASEVVKGNSELYSEETNSNLVEIDTQGVGGELFVDLTALENPTITINGNKYIIVEEKLVQVDNDLPSIMPRATDSYNVTLKNGEETRKTKTVLKGTAMDFTTLGPKERRRVEIRDMEKSLMTYTGSEWGVGIAAEAVNTQIHTFLVTNFSSTTQTWEARITF